MNYPAPIVLFTYKRLDTLRQCVAALQQNYLAGDSELFIFSDAAKRESEKIEVESVRNELKLIRGFKKVTIYETPYNKGLANSIIDGVTQVINTYKKVIVLEDDLVASGNFLCFMNKALDYYEYIEKVFSISGYTIPIDNAKDDVYFTRRSSSWGWATWKDRWEKVDWELNDYIQWNKSPVNRKSFNKMGSDMSKMLKDQMTGKIDSWAIRWCYNQFLRHQYTVYPTLSKIINIGTDANATHTYDKFNRWATILDVSNKTDFIFNNDIKLEQHYLTQFLKQFSVNSRIKYKILNFYSKLFKSSTPKAGAEDI